ncbi:MAG: sulfite exporter TauE/SafE family protein [Actinobacteria bacterium]|nr:sulfite exporter TauE/SafE family protein [Actinomycetota bacterium]
MDPLVILFGFLVGILVGLTGVGGGSLMTPVLILVFGFKPVTAIGTDLAYGAVTKTVGGWRHLRARTVNQSLSWWMAIGSVPAAVSGVWVLGAIRSAAGKGFDDTVLTIVAAALLFTGAATLARALFLTRLIEREREGLTLEARHKVAAIVLGGFVGFVLGITSAGSGSLIAVGLIMLFRMAPRQVVGTDVFHAAILLWAAAIAHVVAGNVDFALAGTILIGSIPGVWVGSQWSIRTPVAALRTTLGVILIVAGLALLSKAGVAIPNTILAGLPLGILAWLLGQAVVRRRAGRPGVRPSDAPVPAPEP